VEDARFETIATRTWPVEEKSSAKLAMSADDRPHEVAIIGGGIAGLSAAWELRTRDVVVLEATDRLGGRIRSEERAPYWLNLGAHVFGGAGTATGRLIEEVGVQAVSVPGRLAAVALNGRIVASGPVESYPLRLPMSFRDRLAVIRAGARIRGAVSRYNRVARPWPGESPGQARARLLAFLGDSSFADYLGRLPPDADAMFRPTVSRSAAEPEQLSAGHGVGYFALVWSKGEGLSRNIVGGSQRLIDGIARELKGKTVLGARVETVVTEPEFVRVRYAYTGEEHELRARHVVVATPAYEAARLVQNLPEDTRRALESIPYGAYLVLALLTGETTPMPWDGIYALATPKRPFNMVFNTANVLRRAGEPRRPGGSLMLYRAGDAALPLLDWSDSEIEHEFLRSLEEIYPQARGIVRETLILRLRHALPYPRPGRYRLQQALDRDLGKIILAGDYLGGWYTDTAIATGQEAAERIRAAL
jgi:oxygen-dependent protoporphyrinogen oxidase